MMYEINQHNRYSHKMLLPTESQLQLQLLLQDPNLMASLGATDVSTLESILPPVIDTKGKRDGKWVDAKTTLNKPT